MIGNVAEIVSDAENAIWGSFRDDLKDCINLKSIELKKGQNNIGFRVAAVLRWFKTAC
jgi:hypothetical protein